MEKTNIYGLKDSKGTIFYIGKSSNLKKRFKQHLYQMIKDNPTRLYNSFRKHVPFSYVLLEEVLIEEWEEKEIYYINLHKDTIYNSAIGGRHSYNTKFNKNEENEIDLKIYSRDDLISLGLSVEQINRVLCVEIDINDKIDFEHEMYTKRFYSKTKQINLREWD